MEGTLKKVTQSSRENDVEIRRRSGMFSLAGGKVVVEASYRLKKCIR